MLLNREMAAVTLQSFSSELDSYGQRQTAPDTTSIDMAIKPYAHANVDDPRFDNVEIIGLTKSEVSTMNRIQLGSGDLYEVLHVQPGERFNQVFMRKI